ncbi:phosphomevalonate kinase [Streptococcus danieliae]|uniref:phosphomevalonate kinase n=1 Tax=Streptococcus danieliae TaxID=747656 RepID=A0A7X3KCK9_9STRE|nr:phosphomevalonate kinase [Streptococcus danieliae]MVX59007.1 phosphomevalonate kinase [Streptococcus danieliae]
MTIKVTSCGKLYVAGEYAILTPGQTALIKNIPIYMQASIGPASQIQLSSDLFDYSVGMEADENYSLIQDTVKVWARYRGLDLAKLPPFTLEISGKMEEDGLKYGIGSSGSVTILVLKALAAFSDLKLSPDLLFRLASYVLLARGDNGSMGDLACIAYEDFISFQAFDRKRVRRYLEKHSLQETLALDWGYQIEVLKPHLPAQFLVGWTRQPAISKDLIRQLQAAIDPEFLKVTNRATLRCKEALLKGDGAGVKNSLNQISDLLENLSPAIYTDKLYQLRAIASHYDAVAKSSGAGGGDCGIAFVFDKDILDQLLQEWEQVGIQLLYQEDFS